MKTGIDCKVCCVRIAENADGATVFLFLLLSHGISHDRCQLPKNVSVSRPDFDEIVCESTESLSSSLDDNTDQGASEIGLLTESSTATAQAAQCDVTVAASSCIGKAPRSKTLKSAKKVCICSKIFG